VNIIKSKINIRSAEFQENANHMQTQVDDLYQLVQEIELGGGEARQTRHKSRGKLLVRERINALLDPGSPFLEISQLAAHNVYQGETVAAAGVVAKITYHVFI